MRLVLYDNYVPCKFCLVSRICSELCPEIEKMLDDDMKPIIEEMEKVMREEYYG